MAGNPTQFMMERAFAAAGLDWRYLTLEVPPENLGDAVRGMQAMGFRGGNVTTPHKVQAVQHLHGLSEAAEQIGAVNCVHREGDRLIGENTDGKGFVESLQEVVAPTDKKVVILGAGGAARAIAVELGLLDVQEISVVNRSVERGQELANLLSERLGITSRLIPLEGDFRVDEETDIVIHATSVGLEDPEAPVPLELDSLREGMTVGDVTFNPPRTRLLCEASARGCKTVDGLGMLVKQGIFSFRTWTGMAPDAAVMREALEEFLEL